tara:strand:+ start:1120 stop:1497 length:378 start_codon:yes stop_codon:yes gene_type:complete
MINTTEFNTRLKKILDYYNLSASTFAETITVQRSSISHILSGRNKPSLEFISKVLTAFPEIDLLWILSGHGQFHKVSTTPSQLEIPTTTPTKASVPISNDSSVIERIVIFYQDGSFKNYEMNTSK